MIKELCVKLVIYKDYTEMHGQQKAKNSRKLVQWETNCSISDIRIDRLDEANNIRFSQFCEKHLKTENFQY